MKTKSRLTIPSASLALVALLAAAPVHAQTVVVTNLHPAGATSSVANATTGTQQAGSAKFGGNPCAVIWAGTAPSFQKLHPDDASSSVLEATSGDKQFGVVYGSGVFGHAAVFAGTKVYTDLHPTMVAAATGSYITSHAGSIQGGYINTTGGIRAAMWTGETATSYVSLHPSGYSQSVINAVSSDKQGGVLYDGAIVDAALWSGTAAAVDLNPNDEFPSHVDAMSETDQVGDATIAGVVHAAVWNGWAASFRDLHPTKVAAESSTLHATTGAVQAGEATFDGKPHAGLWLGTGDSFIDLHTYLPPGYETSKALGVWTDGTTIYVAGSASKNTTSDEAMLWTVTSLVIPPPTIYTPPIVSKPAAPGIALTGKARVTTTRPKLSIKGSTTGKVTSVTYQIGRKTGTATGTATWKFLAKLQPGKNKVTVTAHGPGGNSAPVKISVTRKVSVTRK